MPELSKDLVALLQYFAPGFLVAWVFFGMTSHIKPLQLERVVQALIFTVVIQVLVHAEERGLTAIDRAFSFAKWTDTSAITASILTALLVGLCLSACVNADAFHRLTRQLPTPHLDRRRRINHPWSYRRLK
jgi:chromate transport protein ChrA